MKLIIYNTCMKLEPYDKENSKIEKMLSVWDEIRHEQKLVLYKKEIGKNNQRKLIIPRNYPIKIISEFYSDLEIKYAKRFAYELNELDAECLYEPRNIKQREALAYLNQQEKFTQNVISLKTGDGKTFIGLKSIKAMGRTYNTVNYYQRRRNCHYTRQRINR
jgi:superfamily II DNA or RNA helicase